MARIWRRAGPAQRRGGQWGHGALQEGGDTAPWHVPVMLRAAVRAHRCRRTTATGTRRRRSTGTWGRTGRCWRPPAACAGMPPSPSSVAWGHPGGILGRDWAALGAWDTGESCLRQGGTGRYWWRGLGVLGDSGDGCLGTREHWRPDLVCWGGVWWVIPVGSDGVGFGGAGEQQGYALLGALEAGSCGGYWDWIWGC